jgi:hypothetical protein
MKRSQVSAKKRARSEAWCLSLMTVSACVPMSKYTSASSISASASFSHIKAP